MDAKMWPIVREWLADLSDLSELERDTFLAHHCPDPDLRQEVLAMLDDRLCLVTGHAQTFVITLVLLTCGCLPSK